MQGALRLRCAVTAGRLASRLSVLTGRGRGETLFGRVLLSVDPGALAKLAQGRSIALVTGTNGKTTTTRLLVDLVEQGTHRQVSTAKFGANMDAGIAAALASYPRHETVVLECDELYIPQMLTALHPRVLVLLNLSRDQLHRTGEVRKVAVRWKQALTDYDQINHPLTVIIDEDDPFLEFAATPAADVVRVTFGGRRHPDAGTCPNCEALLDWSAGNYVCACGLGTVPATVHAPAGLSGPARNAVLAVEAAKQLGADVPDDRVAELYTAAPDRVSELSFGPVTVSTHLAKNPESWRVALSQLSSPAVVLAVNARGIDGIDTSWLWDVDYSILRGRKVVCTGERAADVAYRISVQGVDVRVADTFADAVCELAGWVPDAKDVQAIASYTAFQAEVARHKGVRA